MKPSLRFKHILVLVLSVIGLFAHARSIVSLDHANWSFAKGNSYENVSDCKMWESIQIPHCWNAQDGTTPDYFRGKSIYRCTFDAPKDYDKNRVFVRFEGVSQSARVWLNGRYLGQHKGSFTAFCFEMSLLLKAHDNELIVEVTNEKDKNVMPLDGDFTLFGGIYRHVNLLVLPKMCFTPRDFASSGVYVTPMLSGDLSSANLNVLTKVDCISNDVASLRVRYQVKDAENQIVNQSVSESCSKGEFLEFSQSINIQNPHLWNGKQSPYQYRVYAELLNGNKVIDTLSVAVGIRKIEIDPDKGLFLNGKSYNLRGVNRHQDRKNKGWAISDDDHLEDMNLIKEIGANGVRLAHYPQADFFYSLCDDNGILVWAEIPFIGRSTSSAVFYDNCKQQLVELIRQNYNHPSIFCWSLFNELGGKGYYGLIVSELNDLAHHEDASRFTVAAINNDGRPENEITDLVAYNTYPGWYWAQPETMQWAIDWKYKKGVKGLGVSEYGAGASVKHHDQHVSQAPETTGEFHPEEWQAIVHEINYREINKRPYVWGSFVWNMFDFASAGRHEGDAQGINDKGLVTYDRKNKKDAFYFYKANWSQDPVVYITSRRHTDRQEVKTNIKIYSNCSNPQLKVNGQNVALTKGEMNVYLAKDVILQYGENSISVQGEKDGKVVTDSCVWNLKK